MGIKGKMSQWRKGQAKKKREVVVNEFHERAKEFIRRAKVAREELRCDFQPYIDIAEGGQGARPKLQVIDATKELKKEEEIARKAKIVADAKEFEKGQVKKEAKEDSLTKEKGKEAEEAKAKEVAEEIKKFNEGQAKS